MSRLKTTAAYLADIRAAAASGESIDHLEALLRLMQRAESSGRDRRTPSKARRNVGLATDIVVRARDDRYQALQAGGGDAELDTSTGVRRSGREVKQRKIYGDTDDSNSSSDEAAEEGIDEAPKGAASDAAKEASDTADAIQAVIRANDEELNGRIHAKRKQADAPEGDGPRKHVRGPEASPAVLQAGGAADASPAADATSAPRKPVFEQCPLGQRYAPPSGARARANCTWNPMLNAWIPADQSKPWRPKVPDGWKILKDIHGSGLSGMVRGLEATERDVHGVPTRVVSVKEAERAGYPFGAKSDYDILQLSGTATLTGRDCPMEWGKNAQQFFKDFCGDTCMAIAGLERGDKKDHRHVQMAIQIRAKVEHVDAIKRVMTTYIHTEPGMRTKIQLKPFDPAQKFHFMVGYCVKTLHGEKLQADVAFFTHNLSDSEVYECKRAREHMLSQKLDRQGRGYKMIKKATGLADAYGFYISEIPRGNISATSQPTG